MKNLKKDKYVALLRGINVSGQKIIKMADLKVHFENLEFTYVQTYIQSGNVIFCSEKKDKNKLKVIIERKIEEVFNFSVSVIILTKEDLHSAISNSPFNEDNSDISKVHISYLDSIPNEIPLAEIDKYKSPTEEFRITNNNIYLYFPDGYGKTKLNNNIVGVDGLVFNNSIPEAEEFNVGSGIQPYFGITGPVTKKEVLATVGYLREAGFGRESSHIGMIGLLVSHENLKSEDGNE